MDDIPKNVPPDGLDLISLDEEDANVTHPSDGNSLFPAQHAPTCWNFEQFMRNETKKRKEMLKSVRM